MKMLKANKDIDVFPATGDPFRYFRFVSEGPKWNGTSQLEFQYIDLFAVRVSDSDF
jgi:hypothetical protein